MSATATENQCLAALADAIGVGPIESELRERIASLDANLASLFEGYRNPPGGSLVSFITDASRFIVLRNKAEGRLGAVDPSASVPARPGVAAEIFGLLMSAGLRRDKALETLRAERLRLVDLTRSKLSEAVSGIEAIARLYADPNTSLGVTPEQRAGGDSEELDGALGRLAPLMADQLRLSRRLDQLDGLAGIGPQIAAAIEASGGKAAVVKQVVKAGSVLPDPAVESATKQLAAVATRLGALDPASHLAVSALAERDAATERLAKAKAQAAAARQQAAESLVDRAQGGHTEAVRSLLAVATGPLRAALDAARGDSNQLQGVIAVMTETEGGTT